ncbi:TrkH family potassium uptake protein [Buchananella hordeovulneris]|nr:TrkH family potassium uptake protein [Buchananella hordeovulneris]
MRLRRFLMTEPIDPPKLAVVARARSDATRLDCRMIQGFGPCERVGPATGGTRGRQFAHAATATRVVSADRQRRKEVFVKRLAARARDVVDHAARTSPARLALGVFASIIGVVTLALWTPAATASGQRPPFVDALFVATSAVCVTGLSPVDTATYWSTFGHAMIMLSALVGGLGVMTLASLLSLAVSRHIGLTQRLLTASETKFTRLGEVGTLMRAVVITAFTAQFLLTLVLFPRFLTLDHDWLAALWHAAFMAVSIFNNAGFVILPEGMAQFVGDWSMTIPIVVGTVLGAVGFPVILDVAARWRTPAKWSLHTKLTLTSYLGLAVLAVLALSLLEWNNPLTLKSFSFNEKLTAALTWGVNSRSSGLAIVPTEHMTSSSWFLQDALMFVGGGSASTAGGIKVTTLVVMLAAIVAEARGDQDIEAFGRRIGLPTIRLAVAVTFVGAITVGASTLMLLELTGLPLDRALFEVISAFATVGLSPGVTDKLPESAKYLLTALMFIGRTGTMTLAAALALRDRRRVVRFPEERPIIG